MILMQNCVLHNRTTILAVMKGLNQQRHSNMQILVSIGCIAMALELPLLNINAMGKKPIYFYHKSPAATRPVAILRFAGEVLEGRVSMHSYEKSGLHFRSILLTDA